MHRAVYIEPEPIAELLANIDKVGTEESQPSYSPGWAQVSNTPLKLYKGNTYEGGIRAPLVVHWPAGGLPEGAICTQYHHVTDLVPTLLESAGVPVDEMDGISLSYTFHAPDSPTQKTTQHYETAGDRAIWIDGWKAVTRHRRGVPFEDDRWALYHAAEDFSETHDLADRYPERVAAMVATWQVQAQANDVLPLEDDLLSRESKVAPTPRALYVFYPGATRIAARTAPDIFHSDHEINAEVELRDHRANGVLLASGDSMAGYELLMRDGRLEYTYIYTRDRYYRVTTPEPVPPGRHVLTVRGRKTGESSGRIELLVDGQSAGTIDLPRMWQVKSLNAGVRCGENRGAPVTGTYRGNFRFDQTLERLTVALKI